MPHSSQGDRPRESALGPGAPDLRTIHALVRLMKRFDVTALDVGDGPNRIRLRRRGAEPQPQPASVPQAPPKPTSASNVPPPVPPAHEAETVLLIKSPMVGTFYASPSPDVSAFVNVGSVVNAKTVVCIIEAMKVFTEIPAEIAGTIVEVLVKNGQAVEFDQPLFRVAPG